MQAFKSWGDQLRDESRDEGRREGRDEGRREGRAAGREVGRRRFVRLAEQRFGPLDPSLHRRIEQADEDQLDAWYAGLFSATSRDDLRRLH